MHLVAAALFPSRAQLFIHSQQGELTPAALESYTLCMRQRLKDVLEQYTAKFKSLKERQLRSATTDRERRVAQGQVRHEWSGKGQAAERGRGRQRSRQTPTRAFARAHQYQPASSLPLAARVGSHSAQHCPHVRVVDVSGHL